MADIKKANERKNSLINMKKAKPKPLSAEIALGQHPKLLEPRIVGEWSLWLEQRPYEGGRTTALIRPWGQNELKPQELTPQPIDLRSRIHLYGGSPLASSYEKGKLHICWINDSDSCLWSQSWMEINNPEKEEDFFKALNPPIKLSGRGIEARAFADGLIDLVRKRWIGIMEVSNQDYLVAFSLNKTSQEPKVLYTPKDFAGYAALSPDGNELAWIEWQQPFMPWDNSQLLWGEFNSEGDFKFKEILMGQKPFDQGERSVFQPFWSPTGELFVSEDSSGWWNLVKTNSQINPKSMPIWQSNWKISAETGMPQWIYGMRTSASTGKELLTCICKQSSWTMCLLKSDGEIQEIDQPFNNLSCLDAREEKVIAIASNSTTPCGLLELNLHTGGWKHFPITKPILPQEQISLPENFWFKGAGGKPTQGWYYPPTYRNQEKSPLLVKVHSGPTSMASTGLNLITQFWTSRGWGVIDVNYGGSSGFGRAYRERLKNKWGEVDVIDCVSAAQSLIEAGKAERGSIAIEGSSAGGFTVLSCLCATDLFSVGACRYGVSDLYSLVKETHRFEAHYLDSLIGPWPEQSQKYKNHSPLNQAEKIKSPVIFFQGLKDKVVPPKQTEKIVNQLKKNKIPVEIHLYENEGHGFRDGAVQIEVLNKTEKFFRKHLDI